MSEQYAKWEEFSRDRSFGMPPMHDPTAIQPCMSGLRVRKEVIGRDAINARAWDNFHATPPTQISSDHLKQKGATYMDMNPINTRTNAVNYRNQVEYMPSPPRESSRPAKTTTNAPPQSFSQNSYTQRLDVGGFDSRNLIRELRGAVVEDNMEVQTDTSRLIAQRQFYDRWLPPQTAVDSASLQAYELLRPKGDDWRYNRANGADLYKHDTNLPGQDYQLKDTTTSHS